MIKVLAASCTCSADNFAAWSPANIYFGAGILCCEASVWGPQCACGRMVTMRIVFEVSANVCRL
ncbi:hypothetical protein COCSUDRAFT_32960 [Coccomyxa subellipsoidea C-169]|uniref:Uncharacterized protein n=1 Tax=Coccomyxa subellipsoidea (strain C-169) TaxID=574566 RepID=I0Z097_COCSC|nr:hypothetical protein COCSUDRAFT_32960 [Coccomyxa subellipsoidea C-169]EIE24066.1 hypothetical protein COCSUDRAFT_32960 [Coccomyxa subellipsoidea C-169]|eukprot:XP_005648610.1 hypothetical protein COCSUDRAFT_32960 [Coccomyxa subellipsoidea C-169]